MLAEGTSQFLEAQLEDARRQLVDNEKKLEKYRRAHNGQLPNQLEANMQGLHNTEMQLQSLGDVLNRDRDRRDTVKRTIADLEVQRVRADLRLPNAPSWKQRPIGTVRPRRRSRRCSVG